MKKYYHKKILFITCILLLTLLLDNHVYGQALPTPGGTSYELELWLKADAGILTDANRVTGWLDQSGKNRHYSQGTPGSNGRNRPTYNTTSNLLNYYPALNFNENENRLIGPSSTDYGFANKSIYIFYVSKTNTASGEKTVFNFNTSDYNLTGWDGTKAYMTNYSSSGVNRAWANSAYTHSVIGAIRSNAATSGSTTSSQQIYVNGAATTTPLRAPRALDATTNSVIGSDDNGTGNPMKGNLHELVILTGTKGDLIDANEAQKISSYLAIKYGISLESGDYISSNGTIIWNEDAGYTKDIFGIGRDNISQLNQLQAASANNNTLTVYLNDLQPLNTQNTGPKTLLDGQFVMFGSNGAEGSVPYAYLPGEQFENDILAIEIESRTNHIVKTQFTGMTDIKLNMICDVNGAKYILVSNDLSFAPLSTRIYPIDENGLAADVLINEGDYISFATFLAAPGGVTRGLRLWLRADDASSFTLAGDKVEVWGDQTRYGNNYNVNAVQNVYSSATPPTYIECDDHMNFQPTVSFGVYDYLGITGGPMSKDAPDDFTSFVVYYNTEFSSSGRRLYTHGFGATPHPDSPTRRPAMGFSPGTTSDPGVGRLYASGNGGELKGTIKGFRERTTALHMIHTHRGYSDADPGTITHDFGGFGWNYPERAGSVSDARTFGNEFLMAQAGILGGASIDGTGSGSGSFRGLISEVFFYETKLDAVEQDLIKTYLGMKYAITLDADQTSPTINYDYRLSDGQTYVWKGNELPGMSYHNNVAGLVRDNKADLFINKARSSADGAIVTIAVAGHNECGQGRESLLTGETTDLSGLFWGNNGENGTRSFLVNVCGDMDERDKRIWLVDKTNLEEQSVTISAYNAQSPYFGAGYQVYLLVADRESKLKDADDWDLAIPGKFIDGQHRFSYQFPKDAKYTYFSFGFKEVGGGCPAASFTGFKVLQFSGNRTSGLWTDGTTSKTIDLGDDFSVQINNTIDGGARWYNNRYPRVHRSTGSLRLQRNGSSNTDGEQYMTTEIVMLENDLQSAAAATFQILEIDREGRRYDDIEIYGTCQTSDENGFPVTYTVHPKLTKAVKRSSYRLEGSNRAKGIQRPTSSYTNNRGRLNVEFKYPVQKIYIKHKLTPGIRGWQRIGLGPIIFSAPEPLPEPNDDGLIFVKRAIPIGIGEGYDPDNPTTCYNIQYTFEVHNASNINQSFNFKDVLTDGMYWRKIISIEDDAVVEDPLDPTNNTVFNEYNGNTVLEIDKMVVPCGKSISFTMEAGFDLATATTGTYTNQAVMTYINRDGIDKELQTNEVSIDITEAPDPKPTPAKVNKFDISGACYREGANTVLVTMELYIPDPLSDAQLEISFNPEFPYVAGSLKSATIPQLISPDVDPDGGLINKDGISIPSGTHTITFEVKTPATESDLVQQTDDSGTVIVDGNGRPLIIPFEAGFYIDAEGDICSKAALADLFGDHQIPYCTSKEYIITNPALQPRLK